MFKYLNFPPKINKTYFAVLILQITCKKFNLLIHVILSFMNFLVPYLINIQNISFKIHYLLLIDVINSTMLKVIQI